MARTLDALLQLQDRRLRRAQAALVAARLALSQREREAAQGLAAWQAADLAVQACDAAIARSAAAGLPGASMPGYLAAFKRQQSVCSEAQATWQLARQAATRAEALRVQAQAALAAAAARLELLKQAAQAQQRARRLALGLKEAAALDEAATERHARRLGGPSTGALR